MAFIFVHVMMRYFPCICQHTYMYLSFTVSAIGAGAMRFAGWNAHGSLTSHHSLTPCTNFLILVNFETIHLNVSGNLYVIFALSRSSLDEPKEITLLRSFKKLSQSIYKERGTVKILQYCNGSYDKRNCRDAYGAKFYAALPHLLLFMITLGLFAYVCACLSVCLSAIPTCKPHRVKFREYCRYNLSCRSDFAAFDMYFFI